jgi:DNA-binding transcriptional MerR regulator
MNKAEAVAELGVSERTLATYVKNGRIPVSYVKGKTGKIADYSPEDVARLKEELAGEERFASPAKIVRSATDETSVRSATETDTESRASSAKTLARLEPQTQIGQGSAEFFAALSSHIAVGVAEAMNKNIHVSIENKLLLTIPEAMAYSGLKEKPIRDAIKSGNLKSIRVGRAIQVQPEDLKVWVKEMFK